jgi:hypothetical protein
MSDASREVRAFRGDTFCEFFNDMPNELFSHSFAPWLTRAIHLSEKLPGLNAGSYHPIARCAVNPIRHRNRSNVAALAGQVDDCLMVFALLQVTDRQLGDFVPTQATRRKDC